LRTILTQLTEAGIDVIVIRDTPRMRRDFASCLLRQGGATCDVPRAEAVNPGAPDATAAREVPGKIAVLDLTDRICDGTMCPLVKEGSIVYRDRHHLTAAFARTLADEFQRQLEARSPQLESAEWTQP
jgi:hypothetical protein